MCHESYSHDTPFCHLTGVFVCQESTSPLPSSSAGYDIVGSAMAPALHEEPARVSPIPDQTEVEAERVAETKDVLSDVGAAPSDIANGKGADEAPDTTDDINTAAAKEAKYQSPSALAVETKSSGASGGFYGPQGDGSDDEPDGLSYPSEPSKSLFERPLDVQADEERKDSSPRRQLSAPNATDEHDDGSDDRGGSFSPRIDLGLDEEWLQNLEARMEGMKALSPNRRIPRPTATDGLSENAGGASVGDDDSCIPRIALGLDKGVSQNLETKMKGQTDLFPYLRFSPPTAADEHDINEGRARDAGDASCSPSIDVHPDRVLLRNPGRKTEDKTDQFPEGRLFPLAAAGNRDDHMGRAGGGSSFSPRIDLGLGKGWLQNLEAKMGAIKAQVIPLEFSMRYGN